ncbi:MAG TPA: ABC transporter permease, partial [Blastocatellia bacterium]|nr:ABC transporter permease [Blastocatellia bacterium]
MSVSPARLLAVWMWLEGLRQDAAYAIRDIFRRPAFTILVVLTLGAGIGANTAIFSVVNTLLLRPPDFARLDRLVYVFETNPHLNGAQENVSPGNFLDWREQSHSFDHLAGWRNWYYTLAGSNGQGGSPALVRGVRVSASFFSMLGVDAALGRTFRRDEEQPGADQVVVLADRLWKRRFGGDPGIVGRSVLIDGRPFSVIGVLPATFYFLQPDFDMWMPLTVDRNLHDRQQHSVMVLARLAPGVSPPQAQADMESVARGLGQLHPDTNAGWGARIVPLYPSRGAREVKPALLLLFGAVGFVLLIACANVANLLLARAGARQKELAIRGALGATRARLIRQMLTESILLATLGGATGLLLANWGLVMLRSMIPHIATFGTLIPRIEPRVLVFTSAVALA